MKSPHRLYREPRPAAVHGSMRVAQHFAMRILRRVWLRTWPLIPVSLAATCLAGCAVPATQVKVPTMPMRDALELSRATVAAAPPPRADSLPHLVAANIPEGAPRPLLSAPDVRLAYLYEWVDGEGNKHFGEWVAIPVAGFDWVMSDGLRKSIDGSTPQPAPAIEVP
jgi:hypothetical protein